MNRMPQVTARDLIRFLKAMGYIEDRQTGSHQTFWHPERNTAVTVPVHTGCELMAAIDPHLVPVLKLVA